MYEKIKLKKTLSSGRVAHTSLLPTQEGIVELLISGWQTVNDDVLFLRLQKKWFDMIARGEKKEEYRDLSRYWAIRLLPEHKRDQVLQNWNPAPGRNLVAFHKPKKPWKHVLFVNGYSDTSPAVLMEFSQLAATNATKPEWGVQPGKPYFAIHLSSVLSYSNLDPELEYEVYNNRRKQTT